jgi:putative SOS response-associated peptidase YedK
MCNLYHMAPREHVERYFRAVLPAGYRETAVGPYDTGLVLHAAADAGAALQARLAQWGMIAPGARTRRPASRAILTNNARAEGLDERPTYRDAWRRGRRCLIPCAWYQEPNWETGRNIWWQLRRADGAPWALAGLWSDWTDPASGEIVPSFTMITLNCDGHPLLGRLHRPDPSLPDDAQDKRSVLPLEPADWRTWLCGDADDARALMRVPPADRFDAAVSAETDARLRVLRQEALLPAARVNAARPADAQRDLFGPD